MTTASLTAVLTLFLVRGLGARQYGLFALTIGMSSIAVALTDAGISDSTARFVAERRGQDETELGAFVADALKLKIMATGLLCALFAALAPAIADLYGNSGLTWPVRAIALATFGQSTFSMMIGVSTALGRSAVNVRLVAAESVIEVGACIALVLAGAGAAGAAFGRATGYVLGTVIAAVVVLRLSGRGQVSFWCRPRRDTLRLVSGYAGPVFAIDASYTLSSSLSVLLLGAYIGTSASGVFTAPAKLIVLIQYVGLSIANGVAPRLARGEGQEPNVTALNGALRGLIGFQCLVLAPAVVWAHPITRLLLGPGYGRSADVLVALAPYIFFSGLAPLVTTGVSYTGEARRRVPIAFATLVLVAVSGVILIPSHGVVGAAIATDIAFGFYTLAHIWLCRRLLDLRLRVLAWSLASGITAAAAMGIVLESVGTKHLTIRDWLVGGAGGVAAYVVMLIFTGEVRGGDIVGAKTKLSAFRARRKVAATSTLVPDVVPDLPGPTEFVEAGQPGRDPAPHVPRSAAPSRLRPLAGVRARWSTRSPVARVPIAIRQDRDGIRRSPAAQPPAWLQEGFWPRQGGAVGPPAGQEAQDQPPRASAPRASPVSSPRPRAASGPRAPAARAPRAKPPSGSLAQPASRANSDLVYQIVWRLVDDESGVFEVRPAADGGAPSRGPAVVEQSSPVRWGWPMAPAPTPEARRAHAELVERLLAAAWRRAGSGDAWFAHCFQLPDRPPNPETTDGLGK